MESESSFWMMEDFADRIHGAWVRDRFCRPGRSHGREGPVWHRVVAHQVVTDVDVTTVELS